MKLPRNVLCLVAQRGAGNTTVLNTLAKGSRRGTIHVSPGTFQTPSRIRAELNAFAGKAVTVIIDSEFGLTDTASIALDYPQHRFVVGVLAEDFLNIVTKD